jgi:hypothetical protein
MVGTIAALEDPALEDPGPGRPARLGADGTVRWQLTVAAWRRCPLAPAAQP